MRLFNASLQNRMPTDIWPLGDLPIITQINQGWFYDKADRKPGNYDPRKIEELAVQARGTLVNLDLEWWPVEDVWSDATDAEIERVHDDYRDVVIKFQDATDHGTRFGIYGLLPRNAGQMFPENTDKAKRSIGRMLYGRGEDGRWEHRGILDVLDVVMPSLYVRRDHPSFLPDLAHFVSVNIDLNRMANKPIYAFVWQRYQRHHDASKVLAYIGDDNLRIILDTCAALDIDGVALWDYSLKTPMGGFPSGDKDPMTEADYESFYRVIEEYK